MSTKTIYKRIALVAVAALALGGLSVVPASAASSSPVVGTATQYVAVAGTATTTVGSSIAGSDTAPGTLSITVPVGSSVTMADQNGVGAGVTPVLTSAVAGFTFNSTSGVVAITATPTSFSGSVSIIPDVPGTYTVVFTTAGPASATATIYAAGLAYRTGDGAAVSPATTGNGIAGPANTVTVNATTNALNNRALVTVSGAGATINTLVSTVLAAGATSGIIGAGTADQAVIINTPTAGTIIVSQFYESGNGTGIYASTASKTVKITVVAGKTLAAGLSIVNSAPDNTAIDTQNNIASTGYTSLTNAVPLSSVKTAGLAIGQVQVTLLNADLTAGGNLHTISAVVTGSGLAVIDASGSTNTTNGVRAATYTLTGSNNRAIVHLITDGTAGSGTVTISVTDSVTKASTVIGTKSFNSYGAVTKIVATPILSIGKAGGATTGTSAATPTTAAFTVMATDALGNGVGNLSISALSSAITVVNSAITLTADDGTLGSGVGQYNGVFTTPASAVSGGKATLTVRILNPADGVTFLTSDLLITVGGSVATEVITTDKASYAQGEAMVVTITATDASGNPVADGTTSLAAIAANKSVIGLPASASTYKAGVKVYKTGLYAPSLTGVFILTATSTNAAESTITATATVAADTTASDIAQAAADAAAEATDAANAATDAANAAAEAADAATAAAQDAADAVAALATQVASYISNLRKQITSLTNLVIKIQKKVKA